MMRIAALAPLAAVVLGCSTLPGMGGSEFTGSFPTGELEVRTATGTFEIPVEIAETDPQRTRGLSGRPALPTDRGMLFLFEEDQPADQGVWMFGVEMPLSIAYIDSAGRIVAIRDMEVCTRRLANLCPRYPPGSGYRSALEVNRGFFAERGVQEGDEVRLVRRE